MTPPSLDKVARGCFAVTMVIAVAVLVSWLVGTGSVVLPGRVDRPMARPTAWALLGLAAVSYWHQWKPDQKWVRRLAVGVGALVIVLGVWVMATAESGDLVPFPVGVMTQAAALVLLVAATAIILSASQSAPQAQHQIQVTLGLLVAFSGLSVLLGHLMNVPTVAGQPMPAASTGVAFVTLGFGLSARRAANAWPDLVTLPSQSAHERRNHTRALGARLGLVLLVCAAVIAALAWVNASNQHRSARRLLSAAAGDHARHVTDWFEERRADAAAESRNALIDDELRALQADPGDVLSRRVVTRWLESMLRHPEYSSVVLVDPAARVWLHAPEDVPARIDADVAHAVRAATATGDVQFVDVVPVQDGPADLLTWVVPLGGATPFAALIMVATPAHEMWPEMHRWFDRSSSAEVVLVRRDGDDVLFLNASRLQEGAPRRLPIAAQPWLPAVRAAAGESGEVYAPDYRGVPVIAAMRAVEGTPWSLVVKVDQREVGAIVRQDTWLIAVSIGASVMVVMLAGVSVWLRREAGVFRHVSALTARERDSAEQLRLILQSAPDAHILMDASGTIVSWNSQAETTFGWPAAEVIGRAAADVVIPPTLRGRHTHGLNHLRATGSSTVVGRRIHVSAVHRDGHEFPVELTVIPVTVREELMFSGFLRDRTAEVHSEAAVRTLTTAIAQTPLSVVITDLTGAISYVNPRFTTASGYSSEEVVGRNPRILKSGTHPESFYRQLWDTVLAGGVWAGEVQNRRKTGELYWESATISQLRDERGQPLGYVAIKREITAEKQAAAELEHVRAQLAQAQKMESVGRLAGGVAHDFNNMLSVILGHAEMALEGLDEADERREHLVEILLAGRRSADLTRHLLAFARKQSIHPRVVDLNHSVGDMLKMLRRLIGENIDLRWVPGRDLWPVLIDPAQVDQILANLSVNARDAIADTGVVTIATANVDVTPKMARVFSRGRAGQYVELAISDSGCGMTPDVLAHLFEPFFTTKEAGKGTGLGTATVYGIVAQNHGFIHVESVVGAGTSMRVFLPRCEPAVDDARAAGHTRLPRGTETVLIVEDEPAMLETCRRMLTQLGYTVLACRSSAEAQTAFAAHAGRIDLVLTDVVMPGSSGRELAEAVRQMDPSIRVLFMSGYTAEFLAGLGGAGGTGWLTKPFGTADLAAKVREALS